MNKRTVTGVALAGVAISAQSLQAGGIILYELATPDLGLASAGYAARADDAWTVSTRHRAFTPVPSAQ